MADIFYTRVQLKYDTWDNWNKAAALEKIPLKGEVCLVEVPENKSSGMQDTPPSVLMKVGDGVKTFERLPWLSGLAADVHAWAKKDGNGFGKWLSETTFSWTPEGETEAVTFKVASSAQVEALASRVNVLEEAKTDHEGRIAEIEATLGTGGSSENSISKRVETLEGEMDTAQGDISDLEGLVGAKADGKDVDTAFGRIAKAQAAAEGAQATANGKLDAGAQAVDSAKLGGQLPSYYGTAAAVEKAQQDATNAGNAASGAQNTADKAVQDAAQAKSAADAADAKADTNLNTAKLYAEEKAGAALNDAKKYADDGFDVKGAAAGALTDANSYTDGKVGAEKSRAEGVEAGLQKAIDDVEALVGTTTVDSRIATAKSEAISTAAGDATSKANKALEDANLYTDGKIQGVNSSIDGVESKVDTLIGSVTGDDTLSVRDIAADEVAKIVDGAPEALNTLGEIADWITTDESGAPKIIAELLEVRKEVYGSSDGAAADPSKIKANTSAISAEASRAKGIEAGLQTQIKTLVGSEDGTLVANSVIASAIATAKSEAISAAAGDAATKAGTAKSEAIAAAKTETTTQVGAEKSRAEGVEAGLQGAIDKLNGADTVDGSVAKAVKVAKEAAISTAAGDATSKANKALEDANLYTDEAIEGVNSAIDSLGDRPFAAITENSKTKYVIFYCGSSSEMVENPADLGLVQ